MSSVSQYGPTFFVKDFDSTPAEALDRVRFVKNAQENVEYDEAWLQRLIMHQPALLPVQQIESSFAGLIPICMEMPVATGFLDNLLVTPSGNIALIECKLWRNPEARRKVIGQILDYATEISKWSYEKLEQAIGRTTPLEGDHHGDRLSLYERVTPTAELDEADFVDAVSRNLRLGRFLLLIVGDGIQEGVLGMGEYLQQHAGLHFTLGLVELAFFHLPGGGYVAQPRVFARTTNIDRGTVTFEDARIAINPPSSAPSAGESSLRKMSITKEQYIEGVVRMFPAILVNLNDFIDKLPGCDVVAEFGIKSMILRWYGNDTRGWNLGTLPVSGQLWTEFLSARAKEMGVTKQARKYLADIASLIPNASVKDHLNGNVQLLGADGRAITIDALLADAGRAEGWLQAIARFQAAVARAELKMESAN